MTDGPEKRMTKTDRQFAIARIIRKPHTFNELMDALRREGFDVSERTLQRDQTEMMHRGDLLFVGPHAKLTTKTVAAV